MANPSLQIGNSNWAIKEDNLLGYSTAGTRFVPQPITMTRASAGTRVNSSGLVETVELLGSELVTNGDFENNVIGWNKFKSNATESWNAGGYLDFTKTGESGRLGSDVSLETNKTYKISVNVISLGGILDLHVGISDFESPYSGNSSSALAVGFNTIYLTYPGSALSKGVYLQSGGTNYYGLTASIDSISVKEVTKNNLARVDYDGTASSLLVEPERTNTITYSEDFSEWTIDGNSSITPNAITSPDGILNATKLIAGLSSGRQAIKLNNASTGDLAVSIFAKKGEYSVIQLTDARSSTAFINFDLEDGLVGSSAVMSGEIVSLGNDWYRCSATYNSTTDILALRMSIAESSTSTRLQNFSGNGSDGLYIWGCQVEEGSYGTSYIPTNGSTVTRIQDQYSKTGISNLINSEEGVLFVEIAALSLTSILEILTLSDGSYSNVVLFRYYDTSSNDIQVQVRVAGVTTASILFTLTDAKDFNKIAFKYKENDFALWVNGVEVGTDTSGITFTSSTLNKLSFDRGDGGNALFGKVKQLQVFKTALTDSELATLTT
jgi:hypothetical protein